MRISYGITRSVLLIGKYAFKFPSVRNGHQIFLEGLLANWKERQFYKSGKGYFTRLNGSPLLAKSYFCLWFGLCSIQERVQVKTNDLTELEIKDFEGITTDTKPINFGYNYFWELVCLDYPS